MMNRIRVCRAAVVAVALAGAMATAMASGASAGGLETSSPARGYETAFDDGRLNPNRGRTTAAGNAQTSRLWSNTVPRRALPGTDVDAHVRAGPPAGYAYAFDDGRLNPNRGRGSAYGDRQMEGLWSDTVPRRALR